MPDRLNVALNRRQPSGEARPLKLSLVDINRKRPRIQDIKVNYIVIRRTEGEGAGDIAALRKISMKDAVTGQVNENIRFVIIGSKMFGAALTAWFYAFKRPVAIIALENIGDLVVTVETTQSEDSDVEEETGTEPNPGTEP